VLLGRGRGPALSDAALGASRAGFWQAGLPASDVHAQLGAGTLRQVRKGGGRDLRAASRGQHCAPNQSNADGKVTIAASLRPKAPLAHVTACPFSAQVHVSSMIWRPVVRTRPVDASEIKRGRDFGILVGCKTGLCCATGLSSTPRRFTARKRVLTRGGQGTHLILPITPKSCACLKVRSGWKATAIKLGDRSPPSPAKLLAATSKPGNGIMGIGPSAPPFNSRLFPETDSGIVNHAQDRVVMGEHHLRPGWRRAKAPAQRRNATAGMTDKANMRRPR